MSPSGHFTPQQTARLDAVVSELERVEARQRQLDARRLELLDEAREIALSSASTRGSELAHRALRLEVATALGQSEATAERALSVAYRARHEYDRTLTALRTGEISLAHVRVIVDAGAVLGTGPDPEAAHRRRSYETDLLPIAARETPNRLRPIAQRLAAAHAEATLAEQHREAARRRHIRIVDLPDGMADLIAHLPAVEAYAIRDRVFRLARAAATPQPGGGTGPGESPKSGTGKNTSEPTSPDPEATAPGPQATSPGPEATTSGAEALAAGAEAAAPGAPSHGAAVPASVSAARSRDEVRADVFCDLALGRNVEAASGVRAQVQVVVPAALLGIRAPGSGTAARRQATTTASPPTQGTASTQAPAPAPTPEPTPTPVSELVGYGPIDAETAARVVAGSEHWEEVSVSSTGDVLSVDRYVPTPQMRRLLAARDLHCRAPGCRIPTQRCDLDHTRDAAHGGPTRTDNLAHLCRGHHTLKHHTDWQLRQRPGGTMVWTSPTGRRYSEPPPSRVRFHPVADTPAPPKPSHPF